MLILNERDNFIEVRKNVLLSKNDPHFLKKYLNYFPNDSDTLFKYAQQLESEGKFNHALEYYKKANKNGSYLAKNKLIAFDKIKAKQTPIPNSKTNKNSIWLKRLLVFFILLLLLLLAFAFGRFFYHKNEHHYYEKEIYHHETKEQHFYDSETPPDNNVTGSEIDKENKYIVKGDDLPYIVVHNALTRYQQERGNFPKKINELIQKTPENWLSSIPNNIEYERTSNGFKLKEYKGNTITIPTNGIEIHFYPEPNKLSISVNDKPLAIYSVASGRTKLPFNESKINERVLLPNGGDGALGTRGLVLHDNFAIHGTNEPDLIGKNVTSGCLRLHNRDIEIIYPYISKGTPFKVKKGLPSNPVFSLGLPPLPMKLNAENETSPNETFNWKN